MVQGVPASHLRHCPSIDSSPDCFQCGQGKVGGPVSLSSFLPVSFKFYTLILLFSLATGACRQHRGPRVGGKKSVDKQSFQRREKLFSASVPNNNVAPHALPTEASRDHRTEEEIDAVLPWVSWFSCHRCFVVWSSNISLYFFISRLRGLSLNILFALQILLVLQPLLLRVSSEQTEQTWCVCLISDLPVLTPFLPATTSVGDAGCPLQTRHAFVENSSQLSKSGTATLCSSHDTASTFIYIT